MQPYGASTSIPTPILGKHERNSAASLRPTLKTRSPSTSPTHQPDTRPSHSSQIAASSANRCSQATKKRSANHQPPERARVAATTGPMIEERNSPMSKQSTTSAYDQLVDRIGEPA